MNTPHTLIDVKTDKMDNLLWPWRDVAIIEAAYLTGKQRVLIGNAHPLWGKEFVYLAVKDDDPGFCLVRTEGGGDSDRKLYLIDLSGDDIPFQYGELFPAFIEVPSIEYWRQHNTQDHELYEAMQSGDDAGDESRNK